MKVLVLNSGSSSIKYQFIDTDTKKALAWGIVNRIGMRAASLLHKRADGHSVELTGEIVDHQKGLEYILAILVSKNHGVIKDLSEIEAVGHRVVHGGERFKQSVLIDEEVMRGIHECVDLAPLHNPHNIKGILACRFHLPHVPNVAVFDTTFHANIPDYAYIYGLPYIFYKKLGIRRYGFHGMSHYYVSRRAAEIMGQDIVDLKIITCHLGNGCSLAAIDKGRSVDTSMGFTPVEGLVMGTRTGDLDPAVILHIMGREELTRIEASSLLNKHSGLLGISGFSNDMREIIQEMKAGNKRAELAFNVFVYRLKKYIAAYIGVLNGVDAIVFTGGIGENAVEVRKTALKNMDYLGIQVDSRKNNRLTGGKEGDFQSKSSRVKLFVIPTNEELVIAMDTAAIIKEKAYKNKE